MNTNDKDEILKRFKDLGYQASFRFADDSGKEWDEGYKLQRVTEELYKQHPELHTEMEEIASKFLWTLKK